MSLTAHQFEAWVTALRSGDYLQTRGMLKSGPRYCCLGVLADAVLGCAISEDGSEIEGLGVDSYNWLDDQVGPTKPLIHRNDGTTGGIEPHSFPEIADYLAAHRDEYVEATS